MSVLVIDMPGPFDLNVADALSARAMVPRVQACDGFTFRVSPRSKAGDFLRNRTEVEEFRSDPRSF